MKLKFTFITLILLNLILKLNAQIISAGVGLGTSNSKVGNKVVTPYFKTLNVSYEHKISAFSGISTSFNFCDITITNNDFRNIYNSRQISLVGLSFEFRKNVSIVAEKLYINGGIGVSTYFSFNDVTRVSNNVIDEEKRVSSSGYNLNAVYNFSFSLVQSPKILLNFGISFENNLLNNYKSSTNNFEFDKSIFTIGISKKLKSNRSKK